MNLPTFLRKSDELTQQLSKDQLLAVIHEIARTLPEHKREIFLDTLTAVSQTTATDSPKTTCDDHQQLLIELKHNQEILAEINNGIRCLDSEYNEEWDDWYNSDADEVLFSDSMGVLSEIEDTIRLIHKCIDLAVYKEGCELAETLSVLEITAKGDYEDFCGEPLGINDLYEHELLSGSMEKTVRECLYLEYQGNRLEDRAEELLCMIHNFQCYSVRLEDVLQTGNFELPEFEQFLPLWIEYLGTHSGMGVKILLKEAQSMLQDEQQILDTARKYANTCPELYKQILEQNSDPDKNQRMMSIGIEALERISENTKVRSEIALLTAKYACENNQESVCEYCWLEAFRSNPSLVHYLRLRFCGDNWENNKRQAAKICQGLYKTDNELYFMLLFWNKEFDTVMAQGMSVRESLGWSFTFMKEGITSFLLLLYQGTDLPAGLSCLLNYVQQKYGFTAEEFYKGTGHTCTKNSTELLWEIICKWKQEVKISNEDRIRWMNKINQLISLRVDGIMTANRRKYYHECAAFISAYGEVKESHGIIGEKNTFMAEYRKRYPRRSAFIQELVKFGYVK